MRRFVMILALTATATLLASARTEAHGGHGGGSHASHSSSPSMHHPSTHSMQQSSHSPSHSFHSPSHSNQQHVRDGHRFSHGYFFHSRPSYWHNRCWNSQYGCYCYYCPSSCCYYYWCAPYGCYYPLGYSPTGIYNYPGDGGY